MSDVALALTLSLITLAASLALLWWNIVEAQRLRFLERQIDAMRRALGL